MRLFFAILLPEPVIKDLHLLVKPLKKQLHKEDIRWIKPENLHLTLRFMGAVAEQDLAKLITAVSETVLGVKPFAIKLSDVSLFPSEKRPKVLSIVVINQELDQLAQLIEEAIVNAGFVAANKPFRSHISFAYVKRSSRRLENAVHASTIKANKILVEHFELMQSFTYETGAEYQVIKQFHLG